jgi:hypothetical protein
LLGIKNSQRINAEKDENGKSLNSVKGGKKSGKKAAAKLHLEKDENGKSLTGLRIAAVIHAEKDENGKSLHGLNAAAVVNSQIWRSTMDGFISTASGVAKHNRANGWPGEARVRVA